MSPKGFDSKKTGCSIPRKSQRSVGRVKVQEGESSETLVGMLEVASPSGNSMKNIDEMIMVRRMCVGDFVVDCACLG